MIRISLGTQSQALELYIGRHGQVAPYRPSVGTEPTVPLVLIVEFNDITCVELSPWLYLRAIGSPLNLGAALEAADAWMGPRRHSVASVTTSPTNIAFKSALSVRDCQVKEWLIDLRLCSTRALDL